MIQTSKYKEVNRSEPSHSARVPCLQIGGPRFWVIKLFTDVIVAES
jgi:hypothetical protein